MAKQELYIHERMPNLNDYTAAIAYSRYRGGEMKEEQDTIVALEAKNQKLGRFTEPVFIEFHWYEPNTNRDQDNVAFAKKFILDGLQKAGVLINDNYKYVKGFSDHFHYGEGAGVHVVMTEIEDGRPSDSNTKMDNKGK